MYKLDYAMYPHFTKALSKYNELNADNKIFLAKRLKVIEALKTSPRNNQFRPHTLHGKFEGLWSMDTGINSNSDRIIYRIEDSTKTIYLYDIGNHSLYENISIKDLILNKLRLL